MPPEEIVEKWEKDFFDGAVCSKGTSN